MSCHSTPMVTTCTTEGSAATTTSVVPDIAIRWVLQYSCTSNYNLAALSNVNRYWRSVVASVLENFLDAAVAAGEMETNTNGNICKNVNGESLSRVNSIPPEYHHLSNLLLPEMTLEILRRCRGKVECSSNSNRNSSNSNRNRTNDRSTALSPSFCLAWFPPTGIKVHPVNLNRFSDEELSSSNSDSSEEDENDEINFYRQRLYHQRANAIQNRISNNEDVFENCCIEWTGYRNAIDILSPLEYSPMFVKVSD